MHLTADLTHINTTDLIVVANNRQVLAFKHSFSKQHPQRQLPSIFSWQQYLQHYWQSERLNSDLRLIDNIERHYLLESALKSNGQITNTQLINEVAKNADYCANHLIKLAALASSKIQTCEVFSKWISDYQQIKKDFGLIDINDLSDLILNNKESLPAPYVYGFKTLTPLQNKIFSALNYQIIDSAYTSTSQQQSFDNNLDEIKAVAIWAKNQHAENPKHSIVIVCPQLSELQHQLISIFDQTFDDLLVEIGKKSYNISLGLPLSQYGLIQELLNLLELTEQLKSNKINTQLFNQVVRCVYVKGYQSERSARHLLANQASALALETFQLSQLDTAFEHCPLLLALINQVKITPNISQTLSAHLLGFNQVLNVWGFATDRALSSGEYQLFQKYLTSALKLNQLALYQKKCPSNAALNKLKEITSQVVFQPQSSAANIQIIGSLEAEGLCFDKAWVMGMTHDFLPAKLNSPRFISHGIATAHQIPYSSYDLIQTDAQNTLKNLTSLAQKMIFSYAKSSAGAEQLPSPLLDFPSQSQILEDPCLKAIKTEFIDDNATTKFTKTEVKSGVSLLKDQMACAFKGFAHRLNVARFDEPHIGLDRREQGNITHTALQYIYQEIESKEALLKLDKAELNTLISQKIYSALKHYPESKFSTIEKTRLMQLLLKFIETDKLRQNFRVLATERSVCVDIGGLNFNTRLDRLDQMDNGDQIVFDYKTGSASTAKWCAADIAEPQLPIYSVTNPVQGAAFIELNSSVISFKGLSKDPDSLPKQSTRKGKCQDWDEQLIIWQRRLDQAAQDFSSGQAQVSPNKTACDYCEFDLLCRIQK
ncbi:PD-(D/E)XK nuclease family protein [Candidatus Thioglobus sp.]|uniref:PD-(D/E)XK nuclease family protein n=1 Tax=Candidatus Thioglobus sp. TaxID=2026721 RepID=UPI003D0C28CC